MSTSHLTREELIEAGQPLVRWLALRIHRNIPVRVDLEDLIAYGEVGLAEAAGTTNPPKAPSSQRSRTTASAAPSTMDCRK